MTTEAELTYLRSLVKKLFYYLDYQEESDGGKLFNPITISCCRVLMTQPLNELLDELKTVVTEEEDMSELRCPECMSERVTLQHHQTFMANTLEHYCHSMEVQDDDSPSTCLDCKWTGLHRDLNGYGEQQ